MVKKKVVKKTAKRKAATKKKAAPKKANKNTGLSSGLDDTFQNWVNQQVDIMNKKNR